jgi:N-acetylglucosaminyl-diphospho-decaprenol L-rhamnosyltransferase
MHSAMVSRLDVIVVTWNNGASVGRCLDALAAAATHGFAFDRIVVVDNASETPFEAVDYPGLPPLTIIRNAANRGFAEACNQGAAGSQADYLVFLNPDTIVSPDALSGAIAAFKAPEHRQTAIVGLPLVDERGETQATCGRTLTVARIFNQLTGLTRLAPRWCPGFRMTDWDHAETRRVDYVSGACLLVRRAIFDDLRGFDPRFVVYLEDADLALRAARRGWETVYLAGPAVYHESGWMTGRARGLRLFHAWHSLLAYGTKHFGPAGACTVVVMTFGVAPLARVGQAVLQGSGRQALAAASGYSRLWLAVGRRLIGGRRDAPDQLEAVSPRDAASANSRNS